MANIDSFVDDFPDKFIDGQPKDAVLRGKDARIEHGPAAY